jgi:pimeloyl-ACP methyl ester carboxylesterase
MTSLVEQVAAIATALDDHSVSWAFGGAIALAYATREPRGTRDIDVNVFVPAESAAAVFRSAADIAAAHRDDQVRLYWEDTPVDVFFAADSFHGDVAQRCRVVPFAGTTIRVLCPEDLAVFKALFDRPKDWVDIATMADAGAVDVGLAASRLEQLIPGDDRVARLRSTDGL